ncbi:putative Acyltransferase 3 [Desulfosarcina cetonica]|uniref:acyltransferase n=1 Tax=Desulfosarcina cetonica TaxID=90730 RepID=UPI000A4D52F3|nr:acyltransferase [Desulfosarcina cetonica]VTR69406.1 putative Acyltransferase 3 [Desulfosarcina cetonica]
MTTTLPSPATLQTKRFDFFFNDSRFSWLPATLRAKGGQQKAPKRPEDAHRPAQPQQKRPFLIHIHYFRALAIFFVVASHIWVAPSIFEPRLTNTLFRMIRGPLFSNGTVLFVFISGFLFHYLSSTFKYSTYLLKKTQYVILPYLIISLPIILIRIHSGVYAGYLPPHFNAFGYLHKAAYLLLTGKAYIPFWYIPFIAVVFLLAPVWLRILDDLSPPVLLLLFVFPAFFPRHAYLSVNNFIYFIPVYLLGMVVSKHYDHLSRLFTRYRHALLAITGVLAYFSYHYDYLGAIGRYVNLWQKLFLTFAALGYLARIENRKSAFVSRVADLSFGIYFLHPMILWGVGKILVVETYFRYNAYLVWTLNLLSCFLLSYTVALIGKQLCGSKSRYILGV